MTAATLRGARSTGRKRLQAVAHETRRWPGNRHRPILVAQSQRYFTSTRTTPYSSSSLPFGTILPRARRRMKADENGASSVSFDACMAPSIRRTAIYENSARLFFVRLLDSTQVAIEVGRERMGTDKRPGTINLTRTGRQVAFSGQRRCRTHGGEHQGRHCRRCQGVPSRSGEGGGDCRHPVWRVACWNRIRLPERRPHRPCAGGELAVADRYPTSTAAGNA